ncbi:NitT/TauT family transport system substrate-binding protein [Paenibacillus sophorae]|uniref:Thiamine pyrimidine synthase n=1 Tax=Paenibacillus sophorae TaxID=1333845 RepID=A0A1H8IP63_9BACL|nr:ABC transporter substrate-binding protein [Paenibacillus sophorae]QWU16015.1 ABC transporter substrate-binding protein [Paenibacillus sophorae]SEN69777.1 NitT/TauT family transport system substrate-binding protein [Paenibacillus sophorae]
MSVKNRKFRGVLLMAVMALVLSILAGCGGNNSSSGSEPSASAGSSAAPEASTAPAADPVPVKLQLKWVPQAQFAGYYVALSKGYYKDEGLDVQILPGGPDIVPEQQVAGGSADIGVDWVASLLTSQEQEMPLVQIAQIYQKSGLVLVSKKSANINSPADLKGKRVGNWMGGNEFELLALFDKYKLDSNKDIKFTKQGFTMDQFLGGELDAASAMTYNEYQVVLESGVKAEDLNVIDMNDEGVAMLEDNLFANKEWLEANKETAAKFVRASLKGWKDAIADPAAAVDIVMEQAEAGSTTKEHQLKMMEEVAKLIQPEGFDISKLGYTDEAAFKQTADIAFKFGVIKKEANLSEAYTNEIMDMASK